MALSLYITLNPKPSPCCAWSLVTTLPKEAGTYTCFVWGSPLPHLTCLPACLSACFLAGRQCMSTALTFTWQVRICVCSACTTYQAYYFLGIIVVKVMFVSFPPSPAAFICFSFSFCGSCAQPTPPHLTNLCPSSHANIFLKHRSSM